MLSNVIKYIVDGCTLFTFLKPVQMVAPYVCDTRVMVGEFQFPSQSGILYTYSESIYVQ